MKIVKFAYFDEFHCTGSECRDSCCKHWKICINKKEYLKYKNMECSPRLRSVIDTAFKVTGESGVSFAEMQLNENENCRFLGEDSLCMLQKEKGEEALSYTCTVFPRLNANVGEMAVRQSCSATCCHVTEILMAHPEGLSIVEEEYDRKDKYINGGVYSSSSIKRQWSAYPYYWNIVNAEIDILQDRSFSVPERMLILGYFCQKADEYIKNNVPHKIPSLANMLMDKELCGKIAESLKPVQSDENAANKSIEILAKMHRRIQTLESGQTKSLFSEVMKRLEYTLTEKDGAFFADFNRLEYARLCDVFRGIENGRTYIIENLLVNLAFANDPQQGVWANFFILAVFYNTLKVCAPVFLTENYDDKELALALTYAVKMIINSRLAEKGTFKDFIEENKHTLPYAAFLIC